MQLLNHPLQAPKTPSHLKTLAALQALSDSPSGFFTTAGAGDAERDELVLGTRLFSLTVARRGYLYLLRSHLGAQAPTPMPTEQIGKHLLLAAQLFASARNALAKAGLQEQELAAYYLAVRCARRSGMALPAYLQEMAARYAEWIGQRAETMARRRLDQRDLPGFLSMATIAFSAYADNDGPLRPQELERQKRVPVETMIYLHEHMKAQQDATSSVELALMQRTLALLSTAHPETVLPEWLQEVVGRAPGRAAKHFLKAAADQDEKQNPTAAAWCWAHAAEALAGAPVLEGGQEPLVKSAPEEAARRLGELAKQAQEAGADIHERAMLASAAHRLKRGAVQAEIEDSTPESKGKDLAEVSESLREAVTQDTETSPSLGRGLDVSFLAVIGQIQTVENRAQGQLARDIVDGLKRLTEDKAGALTTIRI